MLIKNKSCLKQICIVHFYVHISQLLSKTLYYILTIEAVL